MYYCDYVYVRRLCKFEKGCEVRTAGFLEVYRDKIMKRKAGKGKSERKEGRVGRGVYSGRLGGRRVRRFEFFFTLGGWGCYKVGFFILVKGVRV